MDQKCQSAGLAISTFFVQTAALLEIELGVTSVGALNVDLDTRAASDTNVEGSCVSAGSFYVNWAIRFAVPLLMGALAVALCLATKSPAHQVGWDCHLRVTKHNLHTRPSMCCSKLSDHLCRVWRRCGALC